MRTLRTPRRGPAGQVLIILATTLLIGGSALVAGTFMTGLTTKEMDKAVKQVVEDKDRAKAARAAIKAWKKDAEAFAKRLRKTDKKVAKLLQDHDAQRSEVEALLEQEDRDLRSVSKQVLTHRGDLRRQLTDAEWAAVFAREE